MRASNTDFNLKISQKFTFWSDSINWQKICPVTVCYTPKDLVDAYLIRADNFGFYNRKSVKEKILFEVWLETPST